MSNFQTMCDSSVEFGGSGKPGFDRKFGWSLIFSFTLNLGLHVWGVVVDHFFFVIFVHSKERGRSVVTWSQSDQVILHEGKDLGVEILEARQHLQRLVHQSINVSQVFNSNVPLTFGLKNQKSNITKNDLKIPKMVNFASFRKSEVYSQKVLPDWLIIIKLKTRMPFWKPKIAHALMQVSS